MRLLLLLLPIALAAADLVPAQPPGPVAPEGQSECHGTWNGARFWARLMAPDKQFGGNRVLWLVYEPPAGTDLGGTHLTDCPRLLLDQQLRLVAFDGRDTLNKVSPAAKGGYQVTREIIVGDGADAVPGSEQRMIAGAHAWDLRLAPVLLALAWRKEGGAAVRAVDFFGPRHAEPLRIAWEGETVDLAGTALRVGADGDGRLRTLGPADGPALLTVEARVK